MSKKKTTNEETTEIEGFVPAPGFDEEVEETPEPEKEPEKEPEEKPEKEPEEEPEPDEDPEKKPEKEPEKDSEKEPPKFEFVDEAEPEKPYMEIVHQGKKIVLKTEEEARNYAQKGFDYDRKVGPHGKFARALDEIPEFAKRVGQVWNDLFNEGPKPPPKPELKSIDDYENPNDWLIDNYQRLKALEAGSAPAPTAPQSQPVQQEMNPLEFALSSRDPVHFRRVLPHIKEYAEKTLTKAQYDRVNNDLPSLIQFYDYVKGQVIKTETKQETKPDPPFRVKSGGGEAPSMSEKPAWDTMNKDEFEQEMARIKGIASY